MEKEITPQEKAKELIEFFRPMMYCFVGSEMLTNSFNEAEQLRNAKYCAIKVCNEAIISQVRNWTSGKSVAITKFWTETTKEINKF